MRKPAGQAALMRVHVIRRRQSHTQLLDDWNSDFASVKELAASSADRDGDLNYAEFSNSSVIVLSMVGAEQTQRMLLSRLATTEDLLISLRHDTLADQLADAKLALAQSEYRVLELQKQLKEHGRS